MRRFGQSGFATLEVILMVTVIGILAAIAVPRFNDITARANTARIQADLAAIDTAIAMYDLNNATPLSAGSEIKSALKEYLTDAEHIKPPTAGKCFINGAAESVSIPAAAYTIIAAPEGTGSGVRAALGSYTAGNFYYGSSSTSAETER